MIASIDIAEYLALKSRAEKAEAQLSERERMLAALATFTRSERPAGKQWTIIEFGSEKEAVILQYELNRLHAARLSTPSGSESGG